MFANCKPWCNVCVRIPSEEDEECLTGSVASYRQNSIQWLMATITRCNSQSDSLMIMNQMHCTLRYPDSVNAPPSVNAPGRASAPENSPANQQLFPAVLLGAPQPPSSGAEAPQVAAGACESFVMFRMAHAWWPPWWVAVAAGLRLHAVAPASPRAHCANAGRGVERAARIAPPPLRAVPGHALESP